MEGLNSIEVKGFGTVKAGKYDSVTISGIGSAKGDIEGNTFSSYGTDVSTGKLEVNNLIIAGDFDGEKDVVVKENVDIKGTANLKNKLTCKNLNLAGSLFVKEDLEFNEGSISGKLSVRGNCKSKVLSIIGSVDIDNILECNNIEIGLMDKSYITRIIGKSIEIKNLEEKISKGLFKLIKGKVALKCHEINGDNIYIENVECSIIRGKSVVIGPGCTIENIEYEDKFQANQGSQVKSITCTKEN